MGIDLRQHKRTARSTPSAKLEGGRLFAAIQTLGSKEIAFTTRLRTAQKFTFFSQLGTLLAAGVDLETCVRLSCEAASKNSKLRPIYDTIHQSLQNGLSLSQAMRSTDRFNNFDTYSIAIGENTGELANVFNRLANYYSKAIVQKRKISGALSYPVIVLFTSGAAIFFMLKFVVPMFADTLVRFGGDLPALTKSIIFLSDHVSLYFLIFVLSSVAVWGMLRVSREKEKNQKVLSSFLLKVPVFGPFIHKKHLLHFSQAMDLLLNSKVNLVESISITLKIVTFYPLKDKLKKVERDLATGQSFYDSLAKHDFDPTLTTLVRIGEEVNQLDRIFTQLSKQYEDELNYQSTFMLNILEPITILLLAVIVGVILVAMYLPMFKIGTVISDL